MGVDRIVITGAEIVTCLGASREETWRGVVAGRCGMGPLTALESPLPAGEVGGQAGGLAGGWGRGPLTALESPLPAGKVGGQAVDLPAEYEPGAPREVRYLKWTIERA